MRSGQGKTKTPSWMEKAVLVYGPRKGGTTLFQNLLDGHDRMFTYPAELKTKFFIKRKWGDADDADYYFSESRIPTIKAANLSQALYRAKWNAIRDSEAALDLAGLIKRDVDAVYASAKSPPEAPVKWCAKDVGGKTDRIVALWRGLFGQPQLLFIFRDPLMVTRAILNDRRRKGTYLPVRQIVRETLDAMRVVKDQSRYLQDRDVFAIAYEDLVADTKATMRHVAGFLDLDYTENFEQPTIFGEPVVVATSSRKTKKVFAENLQWHAGLTLREKLIVGATSIVAKAIPKFQVNYPVLRRLLRERLEN